MAFAIQQSLMVWLQVQGVMYTHVISIPSLSDQSWAMTGSEAVTETVADGSAKRAVGTTRTHSLQPEPTPALRSEIKAAKHLFPDQEGVNSRAE